MEYKCLFGSKLLKLNNPRDDDWAVFVNKKASEINEKGYRSIPFHNNLLNYFMTGKNLKGDAFSSLALYQLSSPFFDDTNYPFNFFNILDHKRVWISQLKNYINLDKIEAWATNTEVLPKRFYHLLYQYYMIVENVHWISDSAKADVQKIHDLEVPASYFYELRNLINSL